MKCKMLCRLSIIALAVCSPASAQIYDTNDDVAEIFAGSGSAGFLNAQGTLAMFNGPEAIAADSLGNLYVADSVNSRIRLITTNGTVSTFAGGGSGPLPGFGTSVSLTGYPPFYAMTCDLSGTLWVIANNQNYSTSLLHISSNSLAESLNFNGLAGNSGLCVDSSNNVYFSAPASNQIYRLGANGTLDLFAGSGNPGSANGSGAYASFRSPAALAADQAGNIYVWDSGNCLIRRIDQNQNVTTIAGSGSYGWVDGVGTAASFVGVSSMCGDNFGNIYLACGPCIRKIDASTNVWTVAGSFTQSSYANGAGATARFNGASGLCLSHGMIFVADSGNEMIRSINFNPVAEPVTGPNLAIRTYAGIQINGFVGRTYQIQFSTDLTNWSTSTTLLLTSSPYLWFDLTSLGSRRFYRAFLLP
jgi:hypothetical protein